MVVSSWMQESCHSAYVTGFVFNLVLWFQRQTSLSLCLGSVHNCVASADCTDWHHPRKLFKCLESNFPGLPETFLIRCSTHWTDQSLPSVKSPTDSLYLKYLWKRLGIPLGVGLYPPLSTSALLRHWCCGLATGRILPAGERCFAELLERTANKNHTTSLKQRLLCQSLVKYFHYTAAV